MHKFCWIALAAALVTPQGALASERIALLIGNQSYNAKVGPLKNPHNDIALIGAALRSLKFNVTEVKDADYRNIDTSISRHIQNVRRAGDGAISLIYYSGHGAADPDTKINYLIPVDVANADDEDLWSNSINLNRIVEGLSQQAPSATHYVVFDACRNALNLTRKGKRALTDRGFVPIGSTTGVMVAYATAPGKTATDAGVYANVLAEEIIKPGFDAPTMFRRVALRVKEVIGQDPWMLSSTLPEHYFAGTKQGEAGLGGGEREQRCRSVSSFPGPLSERGLRWSCKGPHPADRTTGQGRAGGAGTSEEGGGSPEVGRKAQRA